MVSESPPLCPPLTEQDGHEKDGGDASEPTRDPPGSGVVPPPRGVDEVGGGALPSQNF